MIAWVDLAHLPHRAMPLALSGGGYHVIVVYSVDVESRTASIGDLADRPIEIPLDALAEARARIRKQKHRLLAVERVAKQPDLGAALPDAMRACADGLLKGRMKNLTLHSFGTWAGQLRADSGKESWSRMFPPGPRLWRGLTSIYQYIEHYGTGGGLSRPLMAEFLEEAGDGARRRPFHALAARYTDLGRGWSELADQALPSDVPDFARARELLDRKAELVLSGEQGAGDVWTTLDELERRPRAEFPLGDEAADALRGRLAPLVDNLYEAERAAAAELQQLS